MSGGTQNLQNLNAHPDSTTEDYAVSPRLPASIRAVLPLKAGRDSETKGVTG